MNASLLLVQFVAPVSLGLAIAIYLRATTSRLLLDLCGTQDRADFWVRVTTVMLTLAPLLSVLLLARNPLTCTGETFACADVVFRQTLVAALGTALLALGLVASRIGRYVPQPAGDGTMHGRGTGASRETDAAHACGSK